MDLKLATTPIGIPMEFHGSLPFQFFVVQWILEARLLESFCWVSNEEILTLTLWSGMCPTLIVTKR
jgi:hypothetical protein